MCVEENLGYDEFILLFEEISTRIEFKAFFLESLSQWGLHLSGGIPDHMLPIMTDHMLHNFARIWCSKSEIVEIRTRLNALCSSFKENSITCSELFEIYESMLVSIRLIRMTRAKIKTFDTNGDGRLDKDERRELVDWIRSSYHRNGIILSDERKELLLQVDEDDDLAVNHLAGIRELSTLFEMIKENRNCFHALNRLLLGSASDLDDVVSSKGSTEADSGGSHPFDESSQGLIDDIRGKFALLDANGTGFLSRAQIMELLDWIFVGQPRRLRIFRREFESESLEKIVSTDSFVRFLNLPFRTSTNSKSLLQIRCCESRFLMPSI